MAAMVANMKTEGLKEDFDGVFDVTVRTSESNAMPVREAIQFTVRVHSLVALIFSFPIVHQTTKKYHSRESTNFQI